MKKKILYSLLILIIAMLIGSVVLAKYVLPYTIIQPPRVSETITPEDLKLASTDITIVTKDTTDIKGYWIKSNSVESKALMICIHGIGGNKSHFLHSAKRLSKIGVESVLIDSRAHGQSGGEFCTYGFKEQYDISETIDYIRQYNDSISIGVWGTSMGGAIAIQALEYDKRLKFGIIESTFTELGTIVYDYQKYHTYGIGLKPLCDIALDAAGNIADFNPKNVSPISSAKHIEQPVVIAHGTDDKRIKFTYGQALFNALRSTKKQFVPVQGAGHLNVATVGGEKYAKTIERFILEHSN